MPSIGLPDWAVAEAAAGLKIGLTVPQIESRLIAKGLTQVVATMAVNRALEGALQSSTPEEARESGSSLIHILASVLVAMICLALAYLIDGAAYAGMTVVWMMGPLVLIWFPAVLERATPTIVTRGFAWAFLLLILTRRILVLAVFN